MTVPMVTGKISAVVVTWNSAREIGGCLSSLSSDAALSEIIVVDNASLDATREIVRGYPLARLMENAENSGFAAAANQGIAESAGEFIFLVNPDVSFKDGFLSTLAAGLESDPAAGAAAPRLLRPDGKTIDSAGLVMRKNRKAIDCGRDLPDSAEFSSPCRVFGACGAAALYRRSMLEDTKISGECFDESFFAYKEDVDLAWRANLMGWKTIYVPKAIAFHSRGWKGKPGGGLSGRRSMPREIRRHSHKNRYLSILKNDDPVNFVKDLPYIMPYEFKLILFSLFFEPFLLMAFWDIIRLLPETLRKRREIMSRRKTSPSGMRRLFV
ncbi:MAG: glycosyltransferase family 2 protein [Nitrospirota bacterium]